MQKENLIHFIHGLFKEVWTELQVGKLDHYYHEDLEGHIAGSSVNFQDVRNRLEYVKNHYLWIKNDLQDILIDGDKIALRLEQTYCVKDTEEIQVYKLMAIYKMRGDKIATAFATISPDVDYFEK